MVLSLLSLAAVAGVVAAKLAVGNWLIAAPVLYSLPGATRELLSGEIGKMAACNGGQVGLSAGAMFIWLASSGIHSIFDGIEIEANATPRPWWKKRAAPGERSREGVTGYEARGASPSTVGSEPIRPVEVIVAPWSGPALQPRIGATARPLALVARGLARA